MKLSVIVPAYQAENDLRHLIEGLRTSSEAGEERIIVDDCSTDRTLEIAQAAGEVRAVRVQRRGGAAAARNVGAGEAQGHGASDWALVFLDADVVPHPDTIRRLRERLEQDPGLAAVIGAYDDQPADPRIISRYRNLLHTYTHRTGRAEASTFWTACGIVRRDWFDRLGGFNPAIDFMEDIDFGMRLRKAGGRILLDPTIEVQHRKGWTLSSLIRMDVWQRAVPWSRLILRSGEGIPNDLNVRLDQRVSAAMACLAVPFSAASILAPMILLPAAGLCLATVAILNWGFYSFLARTGGFGFAIAGFGLHMVYFWCSVAGFLIALISHRFRTGNP